MSVPIALEPSFSAAAPRPLFEDRYHIGPPFYPAFSYDFDPHSGRFLMIELDVSVEPDRIHIVLNRFSELERLAPTDR